MRKRCAIKHGIFKEFLAEFLGTFVLVVSIISLFFLTASSVCAQLTLVPFGSFPAHFASCSAAAPSLRPSSVGTRWGSRSLCTSASPWG